MKASQGCWTCKRRKIGCDRETPFCNNCIRTKRECLGYGIRLIWPGQQKRRRRDLDSLTHSPAYQSTITRHYGEQFLNITSEDVEKISDTVTGRVLIAQLQSRPLRGLSLHAPILEHDGMLLSYYINIISSMISTTQIQNGFSSELLPMALSRRDSSASALYNAMLAVAAIHCLGSQKAALPFKARAIKHLKHSFAVGTSSDSAEMTTCQLAASMMLCVYNVFDKDEGHWHIHLNGAKQTLQKLYLDQRRHPPTSFLMTWFLYHDVLASFTQPSRINDNYPDSIWSMQAKEPDDSIIIGSLGCSVEILNIINQINTIRSLRTRTGPEISSSAPTHAQHRRELLTRLLKMTQQLDPAEDTMDDPIRKTRILTTAEFYRIATLLYLQRVCPTEDDRALRTRYLHRAMNILGTLEVATSPWPLFIVSGEVRTDEDRIMILQTLDQMDAVRHIGNFQALRDIIELLWKQDDLRANSGPGARVDWIDLIDCEVPVPWFV